MIVKESKNSFYKRLKHFLDNHVRIRWLLIIGVTILIIVGMNLTSVYYGMYLHKTGQSMTLSRWVSSLVHHKLSFIPNYISGLFADPKHIDIDIKFKNFQKIAFTRQEALKLGHLVSSSDDWVPARIRYKGETYRIDMRLKGDTPDHWKRADRWSYKIKVKDNKTLFGLRRFAIQDPRTRNYLNEWYCHKLLEYCGLIHLRYDFIDVTINGKSQPIYALEENVEKGVIENNNFREGPIVRYSSGYQWGHTEGLLPYLLGASIDPYQQNRTMRNADLSKQFDIARNLLELFRQNELSVNQVFDVAKLARFFAICDLLGNHHGTSLDNLKFYYNPITSLIEPVGYDLGGFFPLSKSEHGLWGAGMTIQLNPLEKGFRTIFKNDVFQDREFFMEYIKSLEEMAEEGFLDDFFEATQEEYKEKLQILHKSYPWYNFEGKTILYNNQEYIRDFLSPHKNIQVYLSNFSDEKNILYLSIRNVHALPVELLNVGLADSIILESVRGPIILQAAIESEPINSHLIEFRVPDNLQWSNEMIEDLRVNYRTLGTSDISKEGVFPWSDFDKNFVKNDFIRQLPNVSEVDFLTVDQKSKRILFKDGHWSLRHNLIIPEGYQVFAYGGLKLNLSNSAKILTYSPITFVGTEEDPILFYSSDSTGQGFVVLSAEQESLLEYVKFENLAYPSQNGWEMTGAVNFYESPVKISHCQFALNRSEDGLNIIRSSFEIDHTLFMNTMADAFDGDFVKGKISNSSFINCGNDAIDVSGSVVDLHNIFIDGVGDKGLSVGENSRAMANQVEIRNAEIGVTSKDMSTLIIENLSVDGSKVGFTVFQKKPEFGAATITVKNLKTVKVEVPYLLENGSKLILENKEMQPNRNDVRDILYGVEYGKASK